MNLKSINQVMSALVLFGAFCLSENALAFTPSAAVGDVVTGYGSAKTHPCSGAPEDLSLAYGRAEQDARRQCGGPATQVGAPVFSEVPDSSQLWTCGMGTRTAVQIPYECN